MFIADHAVVRKGQLVVGHAHEGHLLGVVPRAQEGDIALFCFAKNQVVNGLPAKVETVDAGAEIRDLP